ncbi:thermonuclease family protein [Candidatus Palauibacter sp.]
MAKNALERLILRKYVNVQTKAHDKYRRRVAQVWIHGRSVNDAMKPYSK